MKFALAIQRENFTAAAAIVSELKKSHPADIKVAMAEAELLAAEEKTDDAILFLNEIVKNFPQAVSPVRYLAVLYTQEGKYANADTIINDALKRIDRPLAQRELDLMLADLYSAWKKPDLKYKVLADLAQKMPDDVQVKRRLLKCNQVIEDPARAQQLVAEQMRYRSGFIPNAFGIPRRSRWLSGPRMSDDTASALLLHE